MIPDPVFYTVIRSGICTGPDEILSGPVFGPKIRVFVRSGPVLSGTVGKYGSHSRAVYGLPPLWGTMGREF